MTETSNTVRKITIYRPQTFYTLQFSGPRFPTKAE
jgi:hypothetical protein